MVLASSCIKFRPPPCLCSAATCVFICRFRSCWLSIFITGVGYRWWWCFGHIENTCSDSYPEPPSPVRCYSSPTDTKLNSHAADINQRRPQTRRLPAHRQLASRRPPQKVNCFRRKIEGQKHCSEHGLGTLLYVVPGKRVCQSYRSPSPSRALIRQTTAVKGNKPRCIQAENSGYGWLWDAGTNMEARTRLRVLGLFGLYRCFAPPTPQRDIKDTHLYRRQATVPTSIPSTSPA